MKTSEFAEKILGLKLFKYQKIMLDSPEKRRVVYKRGFGTKLPYMFIDYLKQEYNKNV